MFISYYIEDEKNSLDFFEPENDCCARKEITFANKRKLLLVGKNEQSPCVRAEAGNPFCAAKRLKPQTDPSVSEGHAQKILKNF